MTSDDLVVNLERITDPNELMFLLTTHYNVYLDNAKLLHVVARKCQQIELYQQSEFFISQALHLQPQNPVLKENQRYLFDQMIDRWHFLMLNDIQRNSSYFKAILHAIRQLNCETVLDIGSGTGILSMMAVRAGAKTVHACELSSVMVTLSSEILAANQMSGAVQVHHTISTNLDALPSRVSLVVTEIVDAGLLGEMIIPTLRHAWKELLLAPPTLSCDSHRTRTGGHVIPCGATVHVSAIECLEIRRQTRLLNPLLIGFMTGINIRGSCKLSDDQSELIKEPYTCERLTQIRNGYKLLTTPQKALIFNFSDPEVPLPAGTSLSIPVVTEGTLDALVAWFDLNLIENISFSTSPSSDISWEQAIFPTDNNPRTTVGQCLDINASCTDNQLIMKVMEPLIPNELIYYVDRSDLCRLNDEVYIQTLMSSLSSAIASVKQDVEECLLLDLSTLPLTCLAAASELDFVLLGNYEPFYHKLLTAIIESNKLQDKVSMKRLVEGQPVGHVTWDIVSCDIITPQGTIATDTFQLFQLMSAQMMSLEDILVLPQNIDIHVVGVASPALRAHSCVLGTIPTLGFDVAQFINKYQVTHYTNLDLTTFPYKPITNISVITSLGLSPNPTTSFNVDNIEIALEITQSDVLTGIAYWFTLHYHGNHYLCTGPNAYHGSHWRQAAFLLQEDVAVTTGHRLRVNVRVKDGVLDIVMSSIEIS